MEFRTVTSLGRFKDIVLTLLRYGFDDLVNRLDIPGKSVVLRSREEVVGLSTYERIRKALEDLGPTFVKLGQVMSLRPDLLPKPLIQELRKLQDDVPPETMEDIRGVLEQNLEGTPDDVFLIFEEDPIAAASLSQVHRAVLREDKTVVAVKVQRPGIRSKIESDLNILEVVANQINERIEEMGVYDLPQLVRSTRHTLLRELDFSREAQWMRIARSQLKEIPRIQVPRVTEHLCTDQLLVMEFIEGSKMKDMDLSTLHDPETLAKRGLEVTIKEILEDGLFHADPHPGNLLITKEHDLCLIDWGMIGRLTREDRFELVDLVDAVVERDSRRLVDTLLKIVSPEIDPDRRALERDLLDILDAHIAVPLKELKMGHLLLDIMGVLRTYRLRMPADLAIMIKALVTAESSARQIYPDLEVVTEAEGHVKRLAMQRFSLTSSLKNLRLLFSQIAAFRQSFPRQMGRIVEKVEKGRLTIRFEHENLGGLRSTLENSSNRLTFGVIIAALIIGSSMIITTGVEPLLFGFPALGVVGYLISGVLGLWLVFNIIRKRRY